MMFKCRTALPAPSSRAGCPVLYRVAGCADLMLRRAHTYLEESMRTAVFILVVFGIATTAHAQGAPPEAAVEGWPPVPPINDQSGIGNYCIHRNLVYSMGDVLCVGSQGLVWVPPGGAGGRPC